jgi:hypothetical protein
MICFFAVVGVVLLTACVGGGVVVRLVTLLACFEAPVFDLHAHPILDRFSK